MRYEVTHGKQTFHVDVKEASPDVFHVKIDGEDEVEIDARMTARTVYSLLIGGRQYEGSVDEREDGTLDVHVGTSAFDLTVFDERQRLLAGAASAIQVGKQTLRAQMPGKIVKVHVAVGDTVELDQGLIVIEAMKMENELKSPVAGVVTAVEVREGDTVDTDALLVVVEPPESEGEGDDAE